MYGCDNRSNKLRTYPLPVFRAYTYTTAEVRQRLEPLQKKYIIQKIAKKFTKYFKKHKKNIKFLKNPHLWNYLEKIIDNLQVWI